jgi:uncharacterized protein YcbX
MAQNSESFSNVAGLAHDRKSAILRQQGDKATSKQRVVINHKQTNGFAHG